MIIISGTLFAEKVINGNHEELTKFNISIKENSININQQMFYDKHPEIKGRKIWGFNASVNCENSVINISDFDYFTLSAYFNNSPSFAYLKVRNISQFFRLNRLNILRLDVDIANVLLVDSETHELNIGIETLVEKRINNIYEELRELDSDIRNSSINNLRVFVPHRNINVQASDIKLVKLEQDCNKTEELKIWQSSTIKTLIVSGLLTKLQIHNTIISELQFTENCLVNELDYKNSFIERTYNCFESTITNKNEQSWKMVMDTAKHNNSSLEHAYAGFQYMKLERKNAKSYIAKISSTILELLCGYGYKPARTIVSAGLIWLASGITYWLLTILNLGGLKISNYPNISSLQLLGYSLYFSIVTFSTTGYGDLVPIGLAKAIAGIEAVSGIVLMSLLIFALTKRYGSFN